MHYKAFHWIKIYGINIHLFQTTHHLLTHLGPMLPTVLFILYPCMPKASIFRVTGHCTKLKELMLCSVLICFSVQKQHFGATSKIWSWRKTRATFRQANLLYGKIEFSRCVILCVIQGIFMCELPIKSIHYRIEYFLQECLGFKSPNNFFQIVIF